VAVPACIAGTAGRAMSIYLNLQVDFLKSALRTQAGPARLHPLEKACSTLPNGCRDCGLRW
jgi:hypothetical protein